MNTAKTDDGTLLKSPDLFDPADAPKDFTMILADFGWPWLCPAVWDPYDERWIYAIVQASEISDGGDNVWLEMETANPPEMKGWMPIPDLIKPNVKGDSQPPEGERGSKTAHSNEDGAPTQSGAGVDVHRLVSLLHFGGGSSECEGYSVATEDQDDNCVLIPFLALLWMPPEYCRQQVQSEPVPHLLIPRRLYDNQRVNRLLEKLAVKLSEIYPDSFLLSTHPLRLKYRNQPYHWWQISLPHFVNLVQRILCIDSGDLIEAGMSLTVSSHAIWRQTQEPKLNMSSGIAAYEYHELAKKESASGENFWANAESSHARNER